LYKSYRESTDRVTKKQAQMIIWAAILPAVIGSITDQLLPYFNIWYGSFVLFSFLFTSIFFFLAITRYRFAQITPELAIESIICCLPDPLLVTDTSGKITYCNNSAVNLFQKPLVNDNFSHFAQREELPALIRSLAAKGVDSRKVELNLHRVSGAVFPAEISLASIRGRGQAVIGLLWIVRDLSDDINLKNTLLKKKAEIEEKIAELERMNKFMANREARLEELRAEALALRYKQN
jgi:PAS domain S-box-containing protein